MKPNDDQCHISVQYRRSTAWSQGCFCAFIREVAETLREESLYFNVSVVLALHCGILLLWSTLLEYDIGCPADINVIIKCSRAPSNNSHWSLFNIQPSLMGSHHIFVIHYQVVVLRPYNPDFCRYLSEISTYTMRYWLCSISKISYGTLHLVSFLWRKR